MEEQCVESCVDVVKNLFFFEFSFLLLPVLVQYTFKSLGVVIIIKFVVDIPSQDWKQCKTTIVKIVALKVVYTLCVNTQVSMTSHQMYTSTHHLIQSEKFIFGHFFPILMLK